MQSWHFECNESDPFLWLPVENEGTLKYLANVYAHNHPKMHLGDTGCSNNGQSMFRKIWIELLCWYQMPTNRIIST